MARIVLGMATSHAPSLNGSIDRFAEAGKRDMAHPSAGLRPVNVDIDAMVREKASWIDKELTPEVWGRRHSACQRAVDGLGDVLDRVTPDVAVVIGDDTYEVFNPDKHIPSIDVFWGDSFLQIAHDSRRSASKDPHMLPGQPELGWHFVEELNRAGFDVSHSRELPEGRSIGHAFDFVYGRVMKDHVPPNVPIFLNTYYPPNQPSLTRCFALGRALRGAIDTWRSDSRVAVIGTGGLSHPVLDEQLDRDVLAALADKDEQRLLGLPNEVMEHGTSEIRNWMVVAGAMQDAPERMTLVDYQPVYRSPAGTGCGCAFAYWE